MDGGIKQKIPELIPSSSRNINQNRQKLETESTTQMGQSTGEDKKKEIEETTSASEATSEKRFCFYGDDNNKRRRVEVRAPPPEVT
jgi:hypothetical protein